MKRLKSQRYNLKKSEKKYRLLTPYLSVETMESSQQWNPEVIEIIFLKYEKKITANIEFHIWGGESLKNKA